MLKFVIVVVVLEVLLRYLTDLSFTQIFNIALAVTVIAYILGDLLVLSVSNNTIATVADGILAFFIIYLFRYAYRDLTLSLWDALIAALVLAVGEWIFHKYVRKRVFPPVE